MKGLGTRVTVAALLAFATVLAGCGGEAPEPEVETAAAAGEEGGEGAEAATAWATPPQPYFHDVTAESGVDFVHDTGAFGEKWLPETIGAGVIVLDADGDDRPDLLFANGRRFDGKPGEDSPQRLYLNRSDGAIRFEEAGPEWGLGIGAYCLGGAAGDLDGDGDHDLYLACLGRDRVLENRGGRFADVTDRAGLTDAYEFGAGAVLFDADHDGDLDALATRYVTWTPDDDLFCSLDGSTKTYCTPQTYPGASPRYYVNRGDGTFEDRTEAAGVLFPAMKAMGVALLDLGDDGHVDVAVAGDTQPNLLLKNDGSGNFEEVGASSGMAYSSLGTVRGGMGIHAADYDRSGRDSVVITYFAQESSGLYRNQGNEFFVDVAGRTDLGPGTLTTLGWGIFFFDYDLDGWLDLFLANGHLDPEVENVQQRVRYAQPQQLFRNLGGGELEELAGEAAGDLAEPRVARGAAYADFDGDGDLDVAVSTNGGPAAIFENRGPRYGHWLRVALRGSESNRDGIGARVAVNAGGVTQERMVETGGSYLSQNEMTLTFGLGEAERVESVVVRWPSGAQQELTDLPVDQMVEIEEAAAGN
ncbi:MAG TPA: CRTAC1 family protein [Thermoanaerobaculia bacterium]|nr:CRTAC1 family protein [Thermoanaerobaculia bacterium]